MNALQTSNSIYIKFIEKQFFGFHTKTSAKTVLFDIKKYAKTRFKARTFKKNFLTNWHLSVIKIWKGREGKNYFPESVFSLTFFLKMGREIKIEWKNKWK